MTEADRKLILMLEIFFEIMSVEVLIIKDNIHFIYVITRLLTHFNITSTQSISLQFIL